jgi:hypothetical protein
VYHFLKGQNSNSFVKPLLAIVGGESPSKYLYIGQNHSRRIAEFDDDDNVDDGCVAQFNVEW